MHCVRLEEPLRADWSLVTAQVPQGQVHPGLFSAAASALCVSPSAWLVVPLWGLRGVRVEWELRCTCSSTTARAGASCTRILIPLGWAGSAQRELHFSNWA